MSHAVRCVECWSSYYSMRDRLAGGLPSLLEPDRLERMQTRERLWLEMLRKHFNHVDRAICRVLEIGCGTGIVLLDLIRWGFRPERIVGIDMLESRLAIARRVLPAAVELQCCNFLEYKVPRESFDLIVQSLTFSNAPDREQLQMMANHAWQLLKPQGAILWYDIIRYRKGKGTNILAISPRKLCNLFPEATIHYQTMAIPPKLARFALMLGHAMYKLLEAVPPLRTHCCALIVKTETTASEQGSTARGKK